MSRPNFFNSKVVYHDNSREYNIDARGRDLASVLQACEASDIEPVQAEEVTPSNLPFLVVSKLQDLNLYSLQEFEGIYRKAVEGDAKTLASFLKKYRDLQVLDFKGKNKKQIFAEIEDFFGDSITYKYPNFAAYFWCFSFDFYLIHLIKNTLLFDFHLISIWFIWFLFD